VVKGIKKLLNNTSRGVVALLFVVTLFLSGHVKAEHGIATSQSFSFLAPGFTQEIIGVSPLFLGGVAFASDGDVFASDCRFGQFAGDLHRFDLQGIAPEINTTRLHPKTVIHSVAGCGLVGPFNGYVYSNTNSGVSQMDAITGLATGNVFGLPGNRLGITVDNQTGDIVYVGANCDFTSVCDIYTVNPITNSFGIFISLQNVHFIDGISFSPDGSQLYLAKRAIGYGIIVVDRDAPGARTGTVNREILLPSEPEGIAFHSSGEFFVVTNVNINTISKVNIATDVTSIFASGGFSGDLSQVGADGCLYTTQSGTRYDDSRSDALDSIVRICGGFVSPVKLVEIPDIIECKLDADFIKIKKENSDHKDRHHKKKHKNNKHRKHQDEDEDEEKEEGDEHSEAGKFRIVFSCGENCEESTIVTAQLNGIDIDSGQIVELKIEDEFEYEFEDDNLLKIKAPEFELVMMCVDINSNETVASIDVPLY